MGKEGENGSHVLKHEQTTSAIQHKLHLKHLVGLVCCRHHHLMPKVTSGSWSKPENQNSSDTDKCNVTNFVFVYHHSTAFTQKPVWDGNTWGLAVREIVLLAAWWKGRMSLCVFVYLRSQGLYWNVRSHIVTNFPRGMRVCKHESFGRCMPSKLAAHSLGEDTHTIIWIETNRVSHPIWWAINLHRINAAPAEGRKHRTEEREDGNKD